MAVAGDLLQARGRYGRHGTLHGGRHPPLQQVGHDVSGSQAHYHHFYHFICRATLAVFSPVLKKCLDVDKDQSIVLPDVRTETLIQIQSLLFGEHHRVKVPSPDVLSAFSCLGLNVVTRSLPVSLSENNKVTAIDKETKNLSKFICSLCGHNFGSLSEVQVHVRESHVKTESRVGHQIENDKSCFNTMEANSHLEAILDKKYKCSYCVKTFSSKTQFTHHTNVHLGIKPHCCPHCKKSFTQPTHLKIHKRIHDRERNFMCSICGKTFSISSNLKKHFSTHERDLVMDEGLENHENQIMKNKENFSETNSENIMPGPFECKEINCGVRFTSEKKLLHHEKREHGKQHVCSICNKLFISESQLKKHVLIHTGEKPYKCSVCQKAFTQKSHVTFHTSTVHNKGTKAKFQCGDCGKSFVTNGVLSKHKMLHTNERPFNCTLCPKSYVQKSHLIVHEVQHTGKRPFLCLDCGKGFTTKQHLKAHRETHTGTQKWYQCSECESKYRKKADLQTHMRVHTGEMPYNCQKRGCGKSFRSLRSLESHERVHTGLKPYHCETCQKSFTTAAGLRQHFKHNFRCQTLAKPGCFKMKISMNKMHIKENESRQIDNANGVPLKESS